jgi:hypothetical protein
MARRSEFDPAEPRPGLTTRPPTPAEGDGTDLKELLSSLGQDVTQLAHDELALARLELRSVADSLSSEVREASRTLVKDLAKVGIALSLATMGGLALTAGLVIGVGVLVGAYWAGGLIVGGLLLIAAIVFAMSAARDIQQNDAIRLEETRRRVGQNTDVLAAEAERNKRFVREEGREFKRRATPPEKDVRH